MDAAPIPLETLLAHRAWVRSVARAVVRDPNAADDVEQETWVAAIATPPRHASSLRGWLGAVARSRARRAGRTATRRVARETAVARGESVASAAELAEIADTHRRVVEAVVALEEPFRAAILLRYFEGLSVEDVALRTGAPLETTRSRLKRGVAKLRERLSRELGTETRPWHLALAPLLAGPRTSGVAAGGAAAGTGGALVATKAAWAAIGVVVAAGAAGVIALKSGDGGKAPPAPQVASAPAAEPPAKPKPPVAVPRVRAAEPGDKPAPAQPAPAAPKEPEETAAQRLKRVKVAVDWDRIPLYEALVDLKERSGVDIVVAAEADAMFAGHHEDAAIQKLQLDIAIPASQVLDLVTQLKGIAYVIEEPRVVIVPRGVTRDPTKPVIDPSAFPMPPKLTVVGRVVDENGAAVPGAKIQRYPGGTEPVATADIAGRFELKLRKPYGSLEAHAPLHIPSLTVQVEGEPGGTVTIELATRGPGGSVKVRVVADADGAALPSARVLVGLPAEGLAAPKGVLDRAALRLVNVDDHGIASADDVAPGSRKLIAQCKGFADASVNVDIVAGRVAEVTLRLAPKLSLPERLKAERVSFNFQAARTRDIVKFLNDAKQLNVVVDSALAPKLEDIPVTLNLNDVSVATALDMICKLIGNAEYVIDEGSDVVFLRAAKK